MSYPGSPVLNALSFPQPVRSVLDYVKLITRLTETMHAVDNSCRFYFRGQYTGFALKVTKDLEKLMDHLAKNNDLDKVRVFQNLLETTWEEQVRLAVADPRYSAPWRLKPSLSRLRDKSQPYERLCNACSTEDPRLIQATMIRSLKRLAEQHLSSVTLGSGESNDFMTWLAIGQHHKVPTFLMDWSVNPLVGLYFAIDDAFGDEPPTKDGEIWIAEIAPKAGRTPEYYECFLHLDVFGADSITDLPQDEPQRLEKQFEDLTLDLLKRAIPLDDRPIAVVPKIRARRMDSQGARFVYWEGTASLNEHEFQKPWRELQRLCWIPASSKKSIAFELGQLYRIHPGTMDADLDGYARYLRWGGV